MPRRKRKTTFLQSHASGQLSDKILVIWLTLTYVFCMVFTNDKISTNIISQVEKQRGFSGFRFFDLRKILLKIWINYGRGNRENDVFLDLKWLKVGEERVCLEFHSCIENKWMEWNILENSFVTYFHNIYLPCSSSHRIAFKFSLKVSRCSGFDNNRYH